MACHELVPAGPFARSDPIVFDFGVHPYEFNPLCDQGVLAEDHFEKSRQRLVPVERHLMGDSGELFREADGAPYLSHTIIIAKA
jgi:hypothetical protein